MQKGERHELRGQGGDKCDWAIAEPGEKHAKSERYGLCRACGRVPAVSFRRPGRGWPALPRGRPGGTRRFEDDVDG